MAGDFAGVAGGRRALPGRGPVGEQAIMPQARTDSLDQFLDFIGLLERGDGENVAVVLLQLLLQLFRQIGQLGGVLQVLFVLGLEDFIALHLPVGQADAGFVFVRGLRARLAALRHRKGGDGRE